MGRTQELQLLDVSLERARVVTVLGPPGAGKTRLVHEYLSAHQQSRCEFVSLVHCTNQLDVIHAISESLSVDVSTCTEEVALSRIENALAADTVEVLALDNAEQVVDCLASLIGRLLPATPTTFLVTSRERLQVGGEEVVSVGPVGLPEVDGSGDSIVRSEAAQLFHLRSRSALPQFALQPGQEHALADLLVQIDGIPLAIELAVAQLNVMPLDELLNRVKNANGTLQSGRRDIEARQRSMGASVAWSWDLLDRVEQVVLAQLSVLSGSFDLALAEAFVSMEVGNSTDLLTVVQNLANKSLVLRARDNGRLYLLKSVRDFAASRLDDFGADAATKERLARYLVAVTTPLRKQFWSGPQDSARAQLAALKKPVQNSIDWAIESKQADLAVPLALAFRYSMPARDFYAVQRATFSRVFELAEAMDLPEDGDLLEARVTAMELSASNTWQDWDDAQTEALAERTSASCDPILHSRLRAAVATRDMFQGEVESSRRILEEITPNAGGKPSLLRALNLRRLAIWESSKGSALRALAAFSELEAEAARLESSELKAVAARLSAPAHIDLGNLHEARICCDRALAYSLENGEGLSTIVGYTISAMILLEHSEFQAAVAELNRALKRAKRLGLPAQCDQLRARLALCWIAQQQPKAALEALGPDSEICSGTPRYVLLLRFALCSLAHWQLGTVDRALSYAQEAVTGILPPWGGVLATSLHGILGALLHLAGHHSQSEAEFAASRQHAGATGSPAIAKAAEVYRGFTSPPGSDTATQILATAAEHFWSDAPHLPRFYHLTIAADLLAAAQPYEHCTAVADELAQRRQDGLLIDVNSMRIRPPNKKWHTLSEKPWDLLESLLSTYDDGADGAVPPHDLIELVWPDELIQPEAATNRLYHNVSKLRRIGLPIEKNGQGYFMSQKVPFLIHR